MEGVDVLEAPCDTYPVGQGESWSIFAVRQWALRYQPHGKLKYFQVIITVTESAFSNWNMRESMGKTVEWLVLLKARAGH